MKGDREQCIAAGIDSYLSKPIRPADLYDTIDELSSVSMPVTRLRSIRSTARFSYK
jgi:CheY-like chemotaxis protein